MKEPLCEERLCTGCGACSQICSRGAVTMRAGEEGFLHPCHDSGQCNECGLCSDICPVRASDDVKVPDNRHKVYACFSKDEAARAKSSSGGVFSQLALKVLSNNGVVFGAGFDENFRVCHRHIDDVNQLDNLRRSKYVQSDIGKTYYEARGFLKAGREVMYCGTPCQIAGLKAFLKQDYDRLLTCDLACHGVPSPKVWSLFLDYLKDTYKSDIKSVSFRDKSTGWNSSSMKIVFVNGSQYIKKVNEEVFFIGFGKSIFNRSSCYDCRFRLDKTKADLTLADFWGIDRQKDPVYRDNKGVSLVITHTEAGEKALSDIAGELFIREQTLEEAVKYNPRLVSSVGKPAGRESFFADMQSGRDFDWLRKKHMDNFSIRYKAKRVVKRILGRA